MSFNFSTNPKTTSNLILNTNPTTTKASSGFTFGTGAGDAKSQKQTSNLFGTPTTTSASFGIATSTPGLSFGTSSIQSGINFAATSAPTTINFGAKTSASSGLGFGSSSGSTSLSGSGTTSAFGANSTSTAPLNFGTPNQANTQSFSLGSTPSVTLSTSTPQFGFGSKPAATSGTTSFTPILGSTATTSSGIALGTSLASSSAPPVSVSFGNAYTAAATTLAPASSVSSLGNLPSSITTLTSTTTSIPSTGFMTFAQLEDSINKWTIDLEEQGKFFINQAKQLNAWDSLLISNGEKILNLNSSIERVKQQQQQLDQELDFVLAQQKELEELIRPLEKELVDIPVTDIDRNQMYQFAEIIDSQLKQMSDDLKEIIEHINDSNKDEEINNPVSQISRILNAHMNSLQWIDRNTGQINSHLEQITKIQDTNRRNFALNHSFNHSFNM